ncbi:hypothetical protein GCM10007977_079390 [Dactylosporangium sucinum]|uniref:T4 beta protein n=2 Tax=Dactylosporangium sucinum TaxID=1424081 RepID=A0A917UA63_9ACTN|nr:hypothetical protein GCM10007977_079390 [Dactylosporangium sucinum]
MYMPVLKGREGEFTAISNLTDDLIPHLLPILEVQPTDKGPAKDTWDFTVKVRERLPSNLLIAVDVRYLADPPSNVRRPLQSIAADLDALKVPMLPVVHLQDSRERMTDVGDAAELHCGRAVLRLGSEVADPDDEDAERMLNKIRKDAGLTPEQCDLVIDMFEVRSERDLTRAEPIARKCLAWARRRPWRSIAVAAGAMPDSVSHLPPRTASPIRRWDIALWQRVQEEAIHYGDYAIAHPRMTGKGWRPGPNLRYTTDDSWWIYRWPDRDANAAMHELCDALISSDHWPSNGATFSWGDEEIARRARDGGRPGNPTNWRAWGTSHHLAQVIDQLNRLET